MDRATVELAQRGDREAFGSLAIELSDRLFGVAHRILRDYDRASDALQVALVRMWRDLPALRNPDVFEGWAYRILIHACQDELRSARRLRPELHALAPGSGSAADPAASVANRESLERAFRKLPVGQRAVIVLHYYRELTVVEIALALQLPVGTVRSRLHYARLALRGAIEADEREAPAEWTA